MEPLDTGVDGMSLAAADYIDIVKKYIGTFHIVVEDIWVGNKNHNLDSCCRGTYVRIGNTKIGDR